MNNNFLFLFSPNRLQSYSFYFSWQNKTLICAQIVGKCVESLHTLICLCIFCLGFWTFRGGTLIEKIGDDKML